MIKISALFLCASVYLYGAGFWNLSGLQKANIYIQNEVNYLQANTTKSIKIKMLQMLKNASIMTNQQDSPTLMLSLKALENDETHYIYIKLALGEEVQIFREDKSKAFALTYDANDFIEVDSDELDSEILEILSQFVEQFEDDRE
ncbi:MAG: hypothetical protein J7K14_03195 [Sulfurimonas sp.]|nr:hypothetical protein [Sulfurimonas sp.]